jgi:hypothetical protein
VKRHEASTSGKPLTTSARTQLSALAAIVKGVPITMQWPDERDMHDSASQNSSSVI